MNERMNEQMNERMNEQTQDVVRFQSNAEWWIKKRGNNENSIFFAHIWQSKSLN